MRVWAQAEGVGSLAMSRFCRAVLLHPRPDPARERSRSLPRPARRLTVQAATEALNGHNGGVTRGEQLLEDLRRQRRAGDPRITAEGREILLRLTVGDLADDFADSLAAVSADDPMLPSARRRRRTGLTGHGGGS